ncbi:XdhC family protein [Neomoorella humiferrea]|uniref:Putative xanthine dehydrogenase subunit A n=1 Tax=Neomoorella humiferrea TaxID=676965 RepID=A0A2T0ALQ8_9FIRM|nr:XdhC family protein [Moorella humiferrea]PRR69692.1 putative xanthine dehydrogenase subunit A [Moorella humiferrea]
MTQDKLAFFRRLLDTLEAGGQAVAATVVGIEGRPTGVAVGDHYLWTAAAHRGSPASSRLDDYLGEVASQVLAERRPRLERIETGEGAVTLFLEPVLPEPEVVVLGGGHVGQQVAFLAKFAGFRVSVIDDRPDFASRELFPSADRIICNNFTAALQEIPITPSTYIVIVTRGHRYDYECLREVIASPAAYIGMIGSRRRVQGVKERLREEGVALDLLERLHAPIGLAIGAETPAEIAISIMAEIIRVYRLGR